MRTAAAPTADRLRAPAAKKSPCAPKIWKKYSAAQKRTWIELYKTFVSEANSQGKILAHNMACLAVWELSADGLIDKKSRVKNPTPLFNPGDTVRFKKCTEPSTLYTVVKTSPKGRVEVRRFDGSCAFIAQSALERVVQ